MNSRTASQPAIASRLGPDATSSDGQQILVADWPAIHAYVRQLFGGDLLP